MSSEVLFARQPILDKHNNLQGFELLYRGSLSLESNAKEATLDVIVNCCTGLLSANSDLTAPLWINLDKTFITSDLDIPIAPEFVVLEILESVRPTPDVLKVISSLHRKGYIIALDDFTFEEYNHAFMPYASIIKVDVLEENIDSIKEKMSHFDFTGKTLLAEKVESKEVFDTCKAIGFDLFQGYYLEKPSSIKGNKLNAGKQTMLHVVNELSQEDISVQEVTDLITTDPILIFKILKMVNSPIYPSKREITSLKEAVIKLGIVIVKRWAIIFSLLSVSSKPSELFRTLLIRAKICELQAQTLNSENKENYFLIGLLSGLDAILDMDTETITNQMELSEHIKQELLNTNKNSILNRVIQFEKGQYVESKEPPIQTLRELNEAYWQSAAWVDELMQLVKN